MQFQLISDMHINHGLRKIFPSAPYLLMAGDICHADDAPQFYEWFAFVSKNWERVFYVPGNHEYYNGDTLNADGKLKTLLRNFKNVQVLQRECAVVEDEVLVVGTTLWTDCNGGDLNTMSILQRCMSDYHVVRVGHRRIVPQDTIELFNRNLAFIKTALAFNDRRAKPLTAVVMTHHAPSMQSIDPLFASYRRENGGYVSDLEPFIREQKNLALWVHGHTHSANTYYVGKTKVVCNPCGYPFEARTTGFNISLAIDVETPELRLSAKPVAEVEINPKGFSHES